jgi:hypothetical protein
MVAKTYGFCARRGMDYGLSRLYGLWYAFSCEPTWWTEKGMGFQGVWVIKAMDYEGVDCISKVSKKVNTAVDESLSKQPKEFFLRQQLAAIQRELHLLQRSNGNGGTALPSIPAPPMNEAGLGGLSELDGDEQHEADVANLSGVSGNRTWVRGTQKSVSQ